MDLNQWYPVFIVLGVIGFWAVVFLFTFIFFGRSLRVPSEEEERLGPEGLKLGHPDDQPQLEADATPTGSAPQKPTQARANQSQRKTAAKPKR